jgi:hypothetical protein
VAKKSNCWQAEHPPGTAYFSMDSHNYFKFNYLNVLGVRGTALDMT